MSLRRDLEHHRDSLGEIGEILSSMKTLAYMETRKLSRFLTSEQLVVDSIEEAASDFLSFHPGVMLESPTTRPVYVLIGSERGFCGDFNRKLYEWAATRSTAEDGTAADLLVVGRKLHGLFENEDAVAAFIEGASVAEDVPDVLQRLTDEIGALRGGLAALDLTGVYHGPDAIATQSLLPPFSEQRLAEPAYPNPPLLNLSATEFLRELIDHYLLAALNHLLYESLMEESLRRVTHLERAVSHIEDKSRALTRRCRSLWQEEITEEIEVILLSSSSGLSETDTNAADG